MGKVVEFEEVYIEYPDANVKDDKHVEKEEKKEESENTVLVESRTTKLSLEELQKRLDETQALHL